MKLLVVGGGGREHAIIKSLKKNPAVTEIFALPGNGGIAADAVCVPIGATEIDKIVAFAWTRWKQLKSPALGPAPGPPSLRAARSFPRIS